MGKCSNCGKKIKYNKFKRYRGKILCYACYDTRLERKKAKKEEAAKTIAEPTEEEKEEFKKYGIKSEELKLDAYEDKEEEKND